jgi:hypothetical protein
MDRAKAAVAMRRKGVIVYPNNAGFGVSIQTNYLVAAPAKPTPKRMAALGCGKMATEITGVDHSGKWQELREAIFASIHSPWSNPLR